MEVVWSGAGTSCVPWLSCARRCVAQGREHAAFQCTEVHAATFASGQTKGYPLVAKGSLFKEKFRCGHGTSVSSPW
jgi:hypothetical protein